jgi:hypothetical protein
LHVDVIINNNNNNQIYIESLCENYLVFVYLPILDNLHRQRLIKLVLILTFLTRPDFGALCSNTRRSYPKPYPTNLHIIGYTIYISVRKLTN